MKNKIFIVFYSIKIKFHNQNVINFILILEHENVKAFVTHGGLMSTLEAIHYAVPMVGLPLFGDQKYNMEIYESKKIAVSLDYHNITEEKLTSALNTVLKDPEVR